jgi:hypothetical protein
MLEVDLQELLANVDTPLPLQKYGSTITYRCITLQPIL